jgi:hypothetical protein
MSPEISRRLQYHEEMMMYNAVVFLYYGEDNQLAVFEHSWKMVLTYAQKADMVETPTNERKRKK